MDFGKRYKISLQLFILVAGLWALSFYNYTSQKSILLNQVEVDSRDLLESARASIAKFKSIEKTLDLQALLRDISLKMDIFEMRFLSDEGITLTSMFESEIGKPYHSPGIELALKDSRYLGKYYMEERDMTYVMAVAYPVYLDNKLVGIIDLAVDITELDIVDPGSRGIVLRRMEQDLDNLLSAVSGSLSSRLKIFKTVALSGFLEGLVHSSERVVGIAIAEGNGAIYSMSGVVDPDSLPMDKKLHNGILHSNGNHAYYQMMSLVDKNKPGSDMVFLSIDASEYVAGEQKLFFTAIATGSLGVLFALAIVYSIYHYSLYQARLENIRLERMVRERTAEIDRLSKTDKLTGLPNRCYLEAQLDKEYRRARRHGHEMALIIIDLDHFKKINDTYGHLAGDAVLKEVGVRLADNLRQTDFVGRFGGEEFVVLLPHTDLKYALIVADNLKQVIANPPVVFETTEHHVTASFGVSTLADQHKGYSAVFQEADKAMYYSKNNGRNRVSYFKNGEINAHGSNPKAGAA